MLAVVDHLSHGMLRAFGARSVMVATGAGGVHAYDSRGSGDGTFALLHGMGTAATSYTGVVRRLRSKARRVLMLDLPGHGRSEEIRGRLDPVALATGVREALDHLLDGDRAVVLGTSLGGAAALGYALERSERVRSLVLASPAGAPLTEADLDELKQRFDLRTRADARRFFGELLHDPPFYLRAMEGGLITQLSRPLVRDFLASLQNGDFFDEARLAALVPPTIVIWGKSDRILPRSGLAFFRKAMPPATWFEELEGVGHSPHLERPDIVSDRLVAAFKRAVPQQSVAEEDKAARQT